VHGAPERRVGWGRCGLLLFDRYLTPAYGAQEPPENGSYPRDGRPGDDDAIADRFADRVSVTGLHDPRPTWSNPSNLTQVGMLYMCTSYR